MGTFETFDHTADVGLRIEGDSLADLLETAARAVFSVVLLDLPEKVEVQRDVRVQLAPELEGLEELLVEWLQELLYHFETKRLVPLAFDFREKGPRALHARVGFGRFDPALHRTGLEVKAVTYHGLEVRQEASRWTARIILDV